MPELMLFKIKKRPSKAASNHEKLKSLSRYIY